MAEIAKTTRARALEERRRSICQTKGRNAASFRAVARLTGRSVKTVHTAMTERESPLVFDREAVLTQVEKALDAIEADA